MTFTDTKSIITFSKQFNKHAFITPDKTYLASVEVAPFQPEPSTPEINLKQATLTEDQDYISFIESQNKPIETPVTPVIEPLKTMTPLIEALIAKKSVTEKRQAIRDAEFNDHKEMLLQKQRAMNIPDKKKKQKKRKDKRSDQINDEIQEGRRIRVEKTKNPQMDTVQIMTRAKPEPVERKEPVENKDLVERKDPIKISIKPRTTTGIINI